MKAYDLVFGLTWFMGRNPEMDWDKDRLTALQTPDGSQWAKIPGADHARSLPEDGKKNTNRNDPPDIEVLRTTTLGRLLANEGVVEAFTVWLGKCQRLMGSSMESITDGERISRMSNARAAAGAVVAAEKWHSDGAWMNATSSPKHEERNWTTEVVNCDQLSDPIIQGPLPISTLPKAHYNALRANGNRNRHR